MMDSCSEAADQTESERRRDPRKGRASVTNGRRTHVTGDPRGAAARRYRDLLDAFRRALGRAPDAVTDSRLRAAAAVALRGELLAAELAACKLIAASDVFAASSELRRALREAGLEAATAAPSEGPNLAEYLAAKRSTA